MNICSGGKDKKHTVVAFVDDCPVCEELDRHEELVAELKVAEDKINELEAENKVLSGRQAY